MSNEVKKEKRDSAMNSFLKSSVGKLAILAAATMSMSSCTSSHYWNSHGYQEGTTTQGANLPQITDFVDVILNSSRGGRYYYRGGRGCSYGTIGSRGGFLGGH